MDLREAYNILGLHYGCDYVTCHARYKELALKYHPDLFQDLSSEKVKEANNTLVQINQAWRILRTAFGTKKSSGVVPVPIWEEVSKINLRTNRSSLKSNINVTISEFDQAEFDSTSSEKLTTELWQKWSEQQLYLIAIDLLNTGRSYRIQFLPQKLIDYVLSKLQSNSANERNQALKILVGFGRKIAPDLISLLSDARHYVRSIAALGLGEIRSLEAISPLIECLSDPNFRVRQRASRALGTIRNKRAIYPLKLLILNENNKLVIWSAALALLQLLENDDSEEELKLILRKMLGRLEDV